jgi:hypothetical protein
MELNKYLDQVAYKDSMEICGEQTNVWKNKFDDSYMTHVGMEENVKFLADREITEQLTHGVGFSPKDGKWYGWSHRAIYGFEVGSTCKKGDCHYFGVDVAAAIEAAKEFWSDENHINVKAGEVRDGKVHISWEYDDKTPNENIRGTISGVDHHLEIGRGEWVAKTMEDAKIMAQDFNKGVS